MKTSFRNNLIFFAFCLILWQFGTLFVNKIVLPSPKTVLFSLREILLESEFYLTLFITLSRCMIGLLFTFLFGILIGLISGYYKLFYKIIYPLVVIIQATPIISWLLLALLWLPAGNVPAFVLIVSSFPIIVISINQGIESTDKKLLEMAKVFGISKKNIIYNIYLPSVKSHLKSTISLILGNSLKIIVMAEVLSLPAIGVGTQLSWARVNIQTEAIFAYTIIVIFLTILLIKGYGKIDNCGHVLTKSSQKK